MSSAANNKHDNLEDAFRGRMHDAEAKPSPDLWARIDHDLTVQESARYKSSMVWYRQLAAACLVLLVAASSVFFFQISKDNQQAAQPLARTAPDQQQRIPVAEEANHTAQPAVQETKQLPAASMAATYGTGNSAETIQQPSTDNFILAEKDAAPASVIEKESMLAEVTQANKENAENYTSVLTVDKTEVRVQSSAGNTSSYFASGNNFSRTSVITPEPQVRFNAYTTARQMLTAMPTADEMRRYPIAANQLLQQQAAAPAELLGTFRQLNNSFTTQAASAQTEPVKLLSLDIVNADQKSKALKEDEPKEQGRWSFGMAYVPSYFDQNIGIPQQMGSVLPANIMGFRMSATTAEAEMKQNMQEARSEFEQNTDPAFSFAVEAKAGYRIGKKWKIFSGLGFTQNTARTKSSYIIKQFWLKPNTKEQEQLNTTTVFLPSLGSSVFTDSVSVAKTDDFYVNYRYRHLTIPVGMQFESNISKSWQWYAAGSIAANLLLETSVMASNNEVEDVHYSRTDHSPFRKMQFSGNVSVGVARRISNNISVSAGPELRGFFDTMLSDSEKALAPQGRPYTVGLNMAVSYDLGGKK